MLPLPMTGGFTRSGGLPSPDQVPGLVIQRLLGAGSDRAWRLRWGRRRPAITAGAILGAIVAFLFPVVGALWLAGICFWLLDAGNSSSMDPYRASVSDRLARPQLE